MEREGLCKHLSMLSGELLVSGEWVARHQEALSLRATLCGNFPGRGVSFLHPVALWGRLAEQWFRCLHLWQGLVLRPSLPPTDRGWSGLSPRAWEPAPFPRQGGRGHWRPPALKGSCGVCRPGVESRLSQLLLCVVGQVAKNLPLFSCVKWAYYKQ